MSALLRFYGLMLLKRRLFCGYFTTSSLLDFKRPNCLLNSTFSIEDIVVEVCDIPFRKFRLVHFSHYISAKF